MDSISAFKHFLAYYNHNRKHAHLSLGTAFRVQVFRDVAIRRQRKVCACVQTIKYFFCIRVFNVSTHLTILIMKITFINFN